MAPLEELDDSTKGLKRWHGAGLLWNCSIPITNTKGSYLYPCPNATHSRPLQHLPPKLMPRRQCPSCTRHRFVPSLYSGHVITYSRMLPLPSTKQPSAEWWRAPDHRHLYRMLWGKFSAEWCFLTKLGPQVSLFPVPISGVNRVELTGVGMERHYPMGFYPLPSLPGKDLSSLPKSLAHPHITSNGVTGKECQTLGTWSIYDDCTRRIVFNYSYVFLFLVPFFRANKY
jgi:hypothetical protein